MHGSRASSCAECSPLAPDTAIEGGARDQVGRVAAHVAGRLAAAFDCDRRSSGPVRVAQNLRRLGREYDVVTIIVRTMLQSFRCSVEFRWSRPSNRRRERSCGFRRRYQLALPDLRFEGDGRAIHPAELMLDGRNRIAQSSPLMPPVVARTLMASRSQQRKLPALARSKLGSPSRLRSSRKCNHHGGARHRRRGDRAAGDGPS